MDDFVSEDDDFDQDEFDTFDVDDDEAETIPCPNCGADVYEDAPRCPSCDEYITASNSVWIGRPWWWIGLGIAGIAATILALSLL